MKAEIYFNHILAGFLEKNENNYMFSYDENYLKSTHPAISFSFPKHSNFYQSTSLFPFFLDFYQKELIKKFNVRPIKLMKKMSLHDC